MTNKFNSYDGNAVSKEYIEEYKEKARNLILFSAYITYADYYNYVFTNKNAPDDLKQMMAMPVVKKLQ